MMKTLYNYLLTAILAVAALACNHPTEPSVEENRHSVRVVVGNFPEFDRATNRAIGTQDEGKTNWEIGDELLVSLTSEQCGVQTATISLTEAGWHLNDVPLEYIEGEQLSATALYAPCYEWAEKSLVLKQGCNAGQEEYLEAVCSMDNNTLTISFEGVERTYSRLRIATLAGLRIVVTTSGFTPAGSQPRSETMSHTLTADAKGNAYLYGTFAPDASVCIESEERVLATYTFAADRFPNGTEAGRSYALQATPQYPLSTHHYASLEEAVADMNAQSVGTNALANSRGARVALYCENGLYHYYILEDMADVSVSVERNCVFELGEHTLTAKENSPLLQAKADCAVVGGSLTGVADGNGTKNSPHVLIHITSDAAFTMEGSNVSVVDNNGGTITALMVDEGCSAKVTKSNLIVTSATGLMSNCVYNQGECTIEQSRLEALSNHCANAAGNDYGQTARAIYSETNSTTTLLDCHIYGAHSGATIRGKLTVDGGTYYGYSHGGLYVSNGRQDTRILNASINECDLPEGFIDDGVAGTNHAGIYIGGSSNMTLYVDNCDFYGLQQPIVLRGSSGESNNTLCISNSRINLNYTHYGIRNDGSNQIKIGVNNNFGVDDLKYARNYELTDDDYGQESAVETNLQ